MKCTNCKSHARFDRVNVVTLCPHCKKELKSYIAADGKVVC